MIAPLRCLTLTLLMLISSLLSAAQNPQDRLLAQELSTYRLLTLFHLLRLEQGAPEVLSRLQAEVQRFEGLLVVEGSAPLAADVLQQAKAFQDVLLHNSQLRYDEIDFYALDALSQSAHSLLQLNRQALDKLAAQPASADLRQAILMQQIAAEYVREAASFDSGSAVYDSAKDRYEPVDVMAKSFSQRLQQLHKATSGSSEQRSKLAQVQVIWNYIEPPLLDYRERSLPFVIDRYSEQIVALLVN
ncbi:hypothetical protein [Pseudomonas sp. Ga0074129]|uniref:hypothetical protein n=1 Tax=Pseudomonas sp. Ga0074129 TaxID=1752219 RepID=UPI000B21A3E2|nr:hypothetical protein [Pseudomonas sp. Ga0074129]